MTDHQNLKMIILIGICFICCGVSIMIGDFDLNWQSIFTLSQTSIQKIIFFKVRLPHTLNAFAIGGLLALAGYLIQGMLANPLADPYTLGTCGGATVFTLLGLMLGLSGVTLIGASFLGALANLLVLWLLLGSMSQVPTAKLLLVGVVMAAFWGATVSLLLIIAPVGQTKPLLFWLFGDIDYQHYPWFALGMLLIAGIVSFFIAEDLKLASQGFLLAKTLGVNAERLQLIICLVSSFITALAVSLGGAIGFVGLIVPHCARFLQKRPSRKIIPLVILLGGTLLVIADIFARILTPPEQLPVGLLTSLLGIPFFLYLSQKHYD